VLLSLSKKGFQVCHLSIALSCRTPIRHLLSISKIGDPAYPARYPLGKVLDNALLGQSHTVKAFNERAEVGRFIHGGLSRLHYFSYRKPTPDLLKNCFAIFFSSVPFCRLAEERLTFPRAVSSDKPVFRMDPRTRRYLDFGPQKNGACARHDRALGVRMGGVSNSYTCNVLSYTAIVVYSRRCNISSGSIFETYAPPIRILRQLSF